MLAACTAGLVWGDGWVFWSALYGAGVVVIPSALMARGMSLGRSGADAAANVVSFALWESVKIAASVLMLMLAPRVLVELVWPALLATALVCIKVHWAALLWRGWPSRRQEAVDLRVKQDGN